MGEALHYTDIQGWGSDLEREKRPGIPKERFPVGGTGAHWDRAEQQVARVKIFHSTERPGLTPVFGTSTPPSGLSGLIRGFAFRLSEGRWAHWLTLLFADRVNMVEGLVNDVVKGHFPNFFKEFGWSAEVKYNPKSLYRRAFLGVGFVGFGVSAVLMLRKKKLAKDAPGWAETTAV